LRGTQLKKVVSGLNKNACSVGDRLFVRFIFRAFYGLNSLISV